MCTREEDDVLDRLLAESDADDDGSTWKEVCKLKAKQSQSKQEVNLKPSNSLTNHFEKDAPQHREDSGDKEIHTVPSKSHSTYLESNNNNVNPRSITVPKQSNYHKTREDNTKGASRSNTQGSTSHTIDETVPPLESLGTISPLLEQLPVSYTEEFEDKPITPETEVNNEIPVNSQSTTTIKSVDSIPNVSSQSPGPSRVSSDTNSLKTTSSKTSFGGFLKNVRSQLSLTGLRKKNKDDKQANQAILHMKFPKGYPVQPELVQRRQSEEIINDTPSITTVMPFEFNSHLDWDPTFKNQVKIEKYNSGVGQKCNNEGIVDVLPDWVSNPVVTVEDTNEPLVTGIEKECKTVSVHSDFEWQIAVSEAKNKRNRDFRRIFVYISGKVEFPNRRVSCLSFNTLSNTLIIGGEDGMLKLLDIEFSNTFIRTENSDVNDVSYTILKHETCKGHKYDVKNVAWHSCGNRFTTYDSKGVIVGWIRSSEKWTPDMIQDGSSSTILGMAWSPQFTKVSFLYEDVNECGNKKFGAVVGLVDGERTCNIEIGHCPPSAIRWIDEIRFAFVQNDKLIMHHFTGLLMNTRYLTQEAKDKKSTAESKFGKVIAFFGKPSTSWTESGSFSLAITWELNRMMLMRKIDDYDHITVQTHLKCTCADWSKNGMFIAIGGMPVPARNETMSQVNIYNYVGKLLSIVKVPEASISSLSWDIDSFYLAIGANNLLYFGSVRPVYKFASTGSVFAYAFTKDGRNFIGIWDTNANKVTVRKVPGKIVDLKSLGERFALLSMNELGIYCVSLFKKTGCPIDTLLTLRMEPFAICLMDSCLVCLSERCVLFWRYKSSFARTSVSSTNCPESFNSQPNDIVKKYRTVHIDDSPPMIPSVTERIDDMTKPTMDPAVCMDGKKDCLCVARVSGQINVYRCPQGGLLHNFSVENYNPYLLMFNPLADRIAMLDMEGCLRFATVLEYTVMEIKISKATTEVLNMMWAQDMPYHLCVLERTKIYILRDKKIEEEFCDVGALEGYLVAFENLQVVLLQLDNILENPETPNLNHLTRIDMKIINRIKNGIKDGNAETLNKLHETVEKRNHPRLWKILGEGTLRKGFLDIAEIAFFKSKNYLGMQLIKKLETIPNVSLKRAEVECFLENYEKAEDYYLEAEKRDLAIAMWKVLGDTNRAKLLLEGLSDHGYKDDYYAILRQAETHFQNGEFHEAISCYTSIEEYDRVLECYIILEDFDGMFSWSQKVPKTAKILSKIAKTLSTFGMTNEAVRCYLADDEIQQAITTALDNFEWSLALQVSEEYKLPIVAPVLLGYTGKMIDSGNIMRAVQFLEKCDKPFASGKLLAMIALKELKENDQPDIVSVKKIFVMAAIQLSAKPKKKSLQDPRHKKTRYVKPVVSLKEDIDLQFDESIPVGYRPNFEEMEWMRKTPWRGAHAVQYLIVVQKLIHRGHFDKAIKLANHLRKFIDILGDERINCMIAIASATAGNYYVCSKALISLEKTDEDYTDIAVELFRDKELVDSNSRKFECARCKTELDNYNAICPTCEHTMPVCFISGSVLSQEDFIWTCETCKGTADARKVKKFEFCPLCHTLKCQS